MEVIDGVIQSCSYSFAIKGIIIPETLDEQTIIGIADRNLYDGVFATKDIVNIRMPSTLKIIGECAFYNNSLTNIIIPNSVLKNANS